MPRNVGVVRPTNVTIDQLPWMASIGVYDRRNTWWHQVCTLEIIYKTKSVIRQISNGLI